MAANFFGIKERYLDIDIGVFDYALRCIDGPYMGKFFHINTSPNGEIIGGAPGYNKLRNPERLTLYMENCELQSRHAQISLNHHCQYFIRDLCTHDSEEPQKKDLEGIWMKVPVHNDGIDLYKNENFRRQYRIGN